MAYMYYWEQDEDSWGHVSLKFEDGNDTVYISWWPKDDNTKKTINETMDRLPTDYEDEKTNFMGRDCTEVYDIWNDAIDLDIGRIREWWNTERLKTNYNFLFNNCCDKVVAAIRLVGIEVEPTMVRTTSDTNLLGRRLAGVPLPPEPVLTSDDERAMEDLHALH